MQPSNLKLKPINDLLGDKFYVPSYQRGYRWTPIQVTELLNDIWDFHKKDNKAREEFYCLQPIVVTDHNGEWELIDGQQRLTTIFLILQYLRPILDFLGKESYLIRYQTRKDSDQFLRNIKLDLEDGNIDYFHFCRAYKVIESWFEKKDKNAKINFLNTLLNPEDEGRNVKIIWYEVSSDTNAIDIFTRINIGKIPLNNAELIRALFLRKTNFENLESTRISLKQLQIGNEWDVIENSLQQNTFWYFICEGKKDYPTRIEYIFDLMKGKKDDDEDYFTFHAFNQQFEDEKNIDEIWLEVKRFFQTFKDWFNNNDLYHLIGYLITTGSSIIDLKNKSEGKTKKDFRDFLKTEISKKVQCQIDELEYGDKQIRTLLLLFNVQTIVNNPNSHIRFPFDSYKQEDWDIEHIRSVKSDKPTGKKQRDWLLHILEYFTGINGMNALQEEEIMKLKQNENILARKIYTLLNNDSIHDSDFTPLYEELLQHFQEDQEPENINSISNLALLDATTNRSYKNAVFPVKRKTILKNDKEGTFIPICTKNVFQKSYSDKVDNVMYWQSRDGEDYLDEIKNCLSLYLPIQKQVREDAKK